MSTSSLTMAVAIEKLSPSGPAPENAFTAEQRALAESGVPAGVADPGTSIPDAEMLRADGTRTTLDAVRGGRPAVVVFYRGAWCPFCNVALRVYQDQLFPPLEARGVSLIAVSPQHPDGSLSMAEKQSLEYAVLSDPNNRLARALGIITRPTEDAHALQLENGLDLEKHNADGTLDVPMPTVVIIGADGTLAWIDVHPDYTARTEPEQVLAALDQLGITEVAR